MVVFVVVALDLAHDVRHRVVRAHEVLRRGRQAQVDAVQDPRHVAER